MLCPNENYIFEVWKLICKTWVKNQNKEQSGALKAPAYAGSGKRFHHLVYCMRVKNQNKIKKK